MKGIFSLIEDYRVNHQAKIRYLLDFIEFTILSFIYFVSVYLISKWILPGWQFKTLELVLFFFFLTLSWYVLSRLTSLAKLPRTQRYLTLIFHSIRMHFIILVILMVVKFLFFFNSLPLIFVFAVVSLKMIALTSFKFFTYSTLKIYRASGYNLHNVLLIADAFSDEIIDKLDYQKEWGFRIAGIMTGSRLIKAKYGDRYPIYPESADLGSLIDQGIIDELIYCKSKVDEGLIKDLSVVCREVGVLFRLQSSVSPLEPIDFQLKTMNKNKDITIVDVPSNNIAVVFKTASDIYFSIITLILLFPFLLLVALLIKLDSRGPVLFVQERVGLRGRKFKLYKFRTMVTGAEQLLNQLRVHNQADGPVYKIKDDPRITRLGKYLRKTGIDEIPQLFNVIKGEMSLIGPRPPLESEVIHYERWQLRRLSVKPGITCTWQVIPNRNDVKFEKWMQMDLNYIDNWSFKKDIKLVFKTIYLMFLAEGR